MVLLDEVSSCTTSGSDTRIRLLPRHDEREALPGLRLDVGRVGPAVELGLQVLVALLGGGDLG